MNNKNFETSYLLFRGKSMVEILQTLSLMLLIQQNCSRRLNTSFLMRKYGVKLLTDLLVLSPFKLFYKPTYLLCIKELGFHLYF